MPRARVDNEQAYILHTYPYRETSLLVEAFSRTHGRIPLIAKGARRPRSALRGMLLSFQPLLLTWSGKGEVRLLSRVEWQGGRPMLEGDALLCGFYLNELLLRLLAREDPHESLFDAYGNALDHLATGESPAPILRSFEKQLLRELGYALTLDRDARSGAAIDPEQTYAYEIERGPVAVDEIERATDVTLSGRALIDIAHDDYSHPMTLAQSKTLMRLLINHRLENRPLHSRRIFTDLQSL